ncbi:MAG: T9SS type A sorting domain-containing protein [Bacteroidota bacterium]
MPYAYAAPTVSQYFTRRSTQVAGHIGERLVPERFALSGSYGSSTADFRDWFFYPSGMNPQEINALVRGAMLKSSLELYAPLDGQQVWSDSILLNLAQSNNVIANSPLNSNANNLLPTSSYCYFPNPNNGLLRIEMSDGREINRVVIYDAQGPILWEAPYQNGLSLVELPAGIYTGQFKLIKGEMGVFRVVKE